MTRSLVTGGAGFIGSHLVEALLERGDEVWVLDDLSTGARDHLAAAAGSGRLHVVEGSVLDGRTVDQIVGAARPERVYHLAAVVGVGLVAADPVRAIHVNLIGTAIVLDVLAGHPQRPEGTTFFLASSSEVYGPAAREVLREDDPLQIGPTNRPRWSYGASKAAAECLALAYARRGALGVVVGRLFNVVGPRQRGEHGMVLPRLVDAALGGGPLVVYDDGRQQRCFAHVADVVGSIVGLVELVAASDPPPRGSPAPACVVNIGGDETVTILELAERVATEVDPGLRIESRPYREVYGPDIDDCRRRVPDLARLRALLGDVARRPLEAIVRETVAWRRAALSGRQGPES